MNSVRVTIEMFHCAGDRAMALRLAAEEEIAADKRNASHIRIVNASNDEARRLQKAELARMKEEADSLALARQLEEEERQAASKQQEPIAQRSEEHMQIASIFPDMEAETIDEALQRHSNNVEETVTALLDQM